MPAKGGVILGDIARDQTTLPAAASEPRTHARVRWLAPSASARSRSRLALREEGKAHRMLFFDGPRQHDDLAGTRPCKPFSETSSFMICVPASATGVSRFVR
jgi:hypothetical protein